MDLDKTYNIPFKNLEEGKHLFRFKIDGKFFEQFEFHNVNDGDLEVVIDLEKQKQLLILDMNIKGILNVNCDLCLDNFDLSLEINDRLFVKFSNSGEEQIDENIIVGYEETEINIAHNLYEIIELNLPYRIVHPPDRQGIIQCDKKMLKKIEELKYNSETKDLADPRWEKLKDINIK